MTMPTFPADVLERAARIRLIGFDVDGTLTDGGLQFDADGREHKRFHVQDGLGLVLLRHAGIEVARLHIGERGKLECMRGIAAEMGIGMDQAAFMGDDLPDLAVMRAVGLAIAPANAHPWVLPATRWVTPHRGGEGAARDACDLLLHAQGRIDALLEHGEHP